MIRLVSSAICVAAALLTLTSALAADRKPDIALKAKYTEVTVSFDDAIRADAPLLKYLTTAGKSWASKTLKELVEQRKDMTDLPADIRNRPWSAERGYTQDALVVNRYASIIRSEFSYTGGAHPNHGSDTLLWDKQTGKMISIRPFFTELADDGPAMTAIRNAVVADLKVEKKKRDPDQPDMSLVDALEPKLLKIGAIALAPSTTVGKSSGLTFLYPPYAVGAYAEGGYTAFVPWEVLKPYLSAEGAAIFGGTQPPDTGDKPK
ncbi:DUF3298 domain-containing protein [Tardiphaga alba]|uniref:DUF3298 domain-containing protein n=1 Tax=Tardiphaga alba TaxID=340268 RepID=A0ABX8A6I7_9BRAD|nr:DUF3298 and DUF4163 domain-containing protein [Tardiphaga alba]QUS39237.1 DUF3298 domain-containing protein [Tardiphaga alba]